MSGDLDVIERWIGDLLSRLDAKEQAKVNRSIAMVLRRSQSQRIGSQQNPDGSRFDPRKPSKNLRGKAGAIRRRGMFTKLRTQKYLKASSNASEISVGFRGRAAMIAMIHQYGLESHYKNKSFNMPVRQLLGLTDTELDAIREAVLSQLSGQ